MGGFNVFYEFNGFKNNIHCKTVTNNLDLYDQISNEEQLPIDLFKLILNGKFLVPDESELENNDGDLFVNLHVPLPGGKGGFGSMLRAIGAQIEKTTNKEACRDLSGRRLRDVNAEKRIKKWLKRKAEQQDERNRKKKEKLERLTQEPKIDFKDDDYLKQKDIIPEKIDSAIDYVLKKKKNQASSTITQANLIDDGQQPCTSSASNNSSDNENQCLNNDSNGNSNDSSDKSNLNDKFSKLKEAIKRKPKDEPVVVSKKKKVQMFLGDDLESSDEE